MSPYGVWCLHEMLSRLKRQVGKVKSEIKTLLPDAVAGLEPSLSCTPTGISPSIKDQFSAPSLSIQVGKSVSRLHLREDEMRKKRKQGRKGGEKGAWDSSNDYSPSCGSALAEPLTCLHPTTAEPESHLQLLWCWRIIACWHWLDQCLPCVN